MNHDPWHAAPEVLARYAAGTIGQVDACSLEAHLLTCARCREDLSTAIEPARSALVWGDIVDQIDAPRPGPVEWLLLRLGVSDHQARLLAATPSLRLSWLLAVVATLAFSVAAAHAGPGGGALFLVLAPLLPLAGVAAAYGPAWDPTAEVTAACPVSGVRLTVTRSVAVVGTTMVLSLGAALALPVRDGATVAWLLPALGLSLGTLALGTYLEPARAAAALAGLWVAVSAASIWSAMVTGVALRTAARQLIAFQPAGQVAFLVAAVAAAAVLIARHDTIAMRRSWP